MLPGNSTSNRKSFPVHHHHPRTCSSCIHHHPTCYHRNRNITMPILRIHTQLHHHPNHHHIIIDVIRRNLPPLRWTIRIGIPPTNNRNPIPCCILPCNHHHAIPCPLIYPPIKCTRYHRWSRLRSVGIRPTNWNVSKSKRDTIPKNGCRPLAVKRRRLPPKPRIVTPWNDYGRIVSIINNSNSNSNNNPCIHPTIPRP